MMRPQIRMPLLVLIASTATAPTVVWAGTLRRVVVISDHQTPGLSEEDLLVFSHGWEFNNAGDVAFGAWIPKHGGLAGFGYGIWSDRSGQLELIARDGMQAPGMPEGVVYQTLGVPHQDAQSRLVYSATVSGPGIENQHDSTGVWVETDSGYERYAAFDNSVPGLPDDANLLRVSSQRLIASGRWVINVFLNRSEYPDESGRWILREDDHGVFSPIVHDGQQAPGYDRRVQLVLFDEDGFRVVLNERGQAAFVSKVLVDETGAFYSELFADSTGELTSIAREGGRPPGIAEEVEFSRLYEPLLSETGVVAFIADLEGEGVVPGLNARGIWSDAGENGLQLIARPGEPAPGLPAGTHFAKVNTPWFGEAGQLYFTAVVEGSGNVALDGNNALWLAGSEGVPELVFVQGDRDPDTFDGIEIRGGGWPVYNALGQYATEFGIIGPGLDPYFPNNGVWATSPEGVLTLIARTGGVIDVSDDPLIEDLRTIKRIRDWQFNDRSEVAVHVDFTDNTWGIFVDRTVAVPETSTALLIGIAIASYANAQSGRSIWSR